MSTEAIEAPRPQKKRKGQRARARSVGSANALATVIDDPVRDGGVDFLDLDNPGPESYTLLTPPASTAAEDGTVPSLDALAKDESWRLVSTEFDAEFYRRQCSDLSTDADPVQHYLTLGWKAGHDPSPHFSTSFYLENSADVRRCGVNPFYHYLKWGRLEGRLPYADAPEQQEQDKIVDVLGTEFDIDYYLSEHPELVENGVDPVRHYVAFGAAMGWDPNSNFSTAFYLDRSPDVRSATVNPFYHYLRWGKLEGRAPSLAALERGEKPYSAAVELLRNGFDADFYLRAHPKLVANHLDPLLHYLHFGWRQGYDPSPDFSTTFYLERSADVRESDESPLHHYLRVGRAEGRLPKPPALCAADDQVDYLEGEQIARAIEAVFDRRYYSECYPDIAINKLDPLQHYLCAGWCEGRDPTPWFSTSYYLSRYPGVAAIRMNPLFHYLVWGKAQGFATFQGARGEWKAKVVPNARLVASKDISSLLHRSRDASGQTALANDSSCLNIHWVIPDFDAGGGGHMTIFRMIKWLEFFGHRCTIWVQWPVFDRTDEQREELLLRHYQAVKARVRTFTSGQTFEDADALIATSWDTAYLVSEAVGVKKKFYFVQDYEPFFHPVGSRSIAAELTYGFAFTCICASPWLERLMREHGSEAHGFMLAADECYTPPSVRAVNGLPRIAVYARTHTSRRATELCLLALEILAERGERFHVDFFGTDSHFDETPFPATNWGIVDAPTLAKLYGEADVGLCFSATNYSLVPQEMMACGLPVVELDTESTREAYAEGVVMMARPDPYDIADKIAHLLHDGGARHALAERGAAWVRTLSWESAARKVETILLSYLNDKKSPRLRASKAEDIKASVVIPTCNGGALYRRVLDAVRAQRTPWPYEIIVIDTESTDGTDNYTVELDDDRIRLLTIAKRDFQHGRTRNLGASLAHGAYVAFLTQDALPADEFWLYNFVLTLDRFPRAAAAFGRHLAWPDASPFTLRDIAAHFARFDRQPLCVSKYTDIARWRAADIEHRRFLHFFSDNNSCLRRSVWQRFPFPEVDYGEDQLWADRIIKRGYCKVYAPKATVYHSHDYDETQTFERARTDAYFFRKHFGYDLAPEDLRDESRALNAETERWGTQNGVTADQIAHQKRLNVVRLAGLAAGATEGVTFASAF